MNADSENNDDIKNALYGIMESYMKFPLSIQLKKRTMNFTEII